jgi:hypothetical protein
MSSTDTGRGRKLAGELYDDALAPLAELRRACGKGPYFPTAREPGAATYYDEASPRTMSPADFEFPGGGDVDGFIKALAAAWTAEGETSLAAMAPRFQEMAILLQEEADEGDGDISILCYTMF